MSASLESRYRRLLAWYPPSHQDVYADEMLGVLLAGARPGQTRPSLRESADLIISRVRARLGSAATGLADERWREAAAAVGVLLPVFLFLKQLRPYLDEALIMGRFGGIATATWTTWLLVATWGGTAALAFVGWRRAAAIAAVIAVVGHAAILAILYPTEPVPALLALPTLLLGVIAAASLVFARGSRRGLAVIGRRSGPYFAVAVLLALAGPIVDPLLAEPVGEASWIMRPEGFIHLPGAGLAGVGSLGFATQLAFLGALVASLIGLKRMDPVIRRRMIALVTPAVALFLLISQAYQGFMAASARFDPPVLLVAGEWLALIVVPVIAFAVAVAVVHRRDRTLELIGMGRAARRTASQ